MFLTISTTKVVPMIKENLSTYRSGHSGRSPPCGIVMATQISIADTHKDVCIGLSIEIVLYHISKCFYDHCKLQNLVFFDYF